MASFLPPAGSSISASPGAKAPRPPEPARAPHRRPARTASGSTHGVRTGDTVSMHYDPMIAKVIAWGPDREEAADRLAAALAAIEVVGLTTNAGFLHALVSHPRFRAADIHTRFIEERMEDFATAAAAPPADEDLAVAAWAVAARDDAAAGESPGAGDGGSGDAGGDPWSPWSRRDHWRMNGAGERIVRLRPGGGGGDGDGDLVEIAVGGGGADGSRAYEVRLPSGRETSVRGEPGAGGRWEVRVDGTRQAVTVVAQGGSLTLFRAGRRLAFARHDPGAVSGGLEMAGGSPPPCRGASSRCSSSPASRSARVRRCSSSKR